MNILSFLKQIVLDIKPWFKTTWIWFLVGAFIGALFFFPVPNLLESILEIFEDKFGDTPNLDNGLVFNIFFNNMGVSAVALIGGLLVGLGPFVVVFTNGFLLGYIIISVTVLSQSNWFYALLAILIGILPHGIFEIPAFLLAASYGLLIGIDWLKKENVGRRGAIFLSNIKKAMIGIPTIAFLLLIAAFVEVYISGKLLESFMQ